MIHKLLKLFYQSKDDGGSLTSQYTDWVSLNPTFLVDQVSLSECETEWSLAVLYHVATSAELQLYQVQGENE
jgi:hypothetical protein